jgi:hypothetical protein
MKFTTKIQVLCLILAIAHAVALVITREGIFMTSCNIFVAASFIIGALEQ